MASTFNVIKWLNHIIYGVREKTKVATVDIENILYFALVWNIFEDELTNAKSLAANGDDGKSLNIGEIERQVNILGNQNLLKMDTFKPFLEKFRNRYIHDGKPTNFEFNFQNRPKENEAKRNLEDVLTNDQTDVKKVVFALLTIAYRLRNNLIHGVKEVAELPEQNDNFAVINEMLAKFIEISITRK